MVSTWYPLGLYTSGFLWLFAGVVFGFVMGHLVDLV